ncbi:hypothetical protein EYR40_007552 [Pleurotus pulmonarius]|nr:hypothetical protein EYR40_007552 [Pleurotus pulmonarius]
MLVPSPHFSSGLIDRPARPMFTCRRCGFSNLLLDMCLWCCWTSVEAKAEWAQSERLYYSTKSTHETSVSSRRRSRRISAPPKVFWHYPITPSPHRRRSEPTAGTYTSLPPPPRLERSVSSTGCDDIKTVAELRSGGVASPSSSTSRPPIYVTKTTTTSRQTANPPLRDGVMSSTKSCLQTTPAANGGRHSNTSSLRASSIRIILPPRPSSVGRPSTSPQARNDQHTQSALRLHYTQSRIRIESISTTGSSSPSTPTSTSSLISLPTIPGTPNIPSTFPHNITPSNMHSYTPHDCSHDTDTHDDNSRITVAIPELHCDDPAHRQKDSISQSEATRLSADGSSFMDLSPDASVDQAIEEDEIVDTAERDAPSPLPEVNVLPVAPVSDASITGMPFPTVPASIHRHEVTTTQFSAPSTLPDKTINTDFPTNAGRRGRDRASAPPPTHYGLQFLDLSDDSNEFTPSGKAHSIGGLPVRARTLIDRKRECLRVPEPEQIEPRRASHDEETKADEGQRERGERLAHGRSKSQPASSIRIGNPGRPYYSAIRPNMNVGASFSQPSSPIRPTYDSRPSSRGVSPRPGSSAAYLSTSYPASRASSPAPSSYPHFSHPKTKSFLDIDVLDDEEYLFSSLTPASALPPVYAQSYATSEPYIHRTGMGFSGMGLGLGSGVFGNPEVAIGPRPTSSAGYRESRELSRSDVEDPLEASLRHASMAARSRKDRFALSRVWRRKRESTPGSPSSLHMSDGDLGLENGTQSHKNEFGERFAVDLNKIKEMGKDVGKIGVDGVAEQMKKVGRGFRSLRSFVTIRRSR